MFFGQVDWNGKAMSKRSSDDGHDVEPDQISSPRSAGSSSKSQGLEGHGQVGPGATRNVSGDATVETLKNMLFKKEAKLQQLQKEKKN